MHEDKSLAGRNDPKKQTRKSDAGPPPGGTRKRHADFPLPARRRLTRLEAEASGKLASVAGDRARQTKPKSGNPSGRLWQAEESYLAGFPMLDPNPVVEAAVNGSVHFMNPAAEALFPGLRRKKLAHPWLADLEAAAEACLANPSRGTVRELHVDDRWYEQTFFYIESTRRIRIYGKDVTGQKLLDEPLKELRRLNRILTALGKSNHALMRAKDEQDYIEKVCRIVAEDCGHAVAWVGFAVRDDERTVRVAARSDIGYRYLSALGITWSDDDRGRGPTGTAIRTGKSSVFRKMKSELTFGPWRDEAEREGFESAIGLPLIANGEVFGSLTIYSREMGAFSVDEVTLLEEFAGDLSSGIMALRWRDAHASAEAALQESEERYRSLFNSMTEGFALHEIICDDEGKPLNYRFLDVNAAFEELTGLKREEIIGKDKTEVLPDDDPKWIAIYGEVALTGKPVHFEDYNPALGKYYDVLAFRPSPFRFATILTDITDRKAAELTLSERTLQLESVNKELESFSYSVSHDLRTPLRAIDGYARIIMKRQKDGFDEETLRQFGLIRENVQTMNKLIEDLLAFSRLGRKEPAMVELDMCGLFADAWADLKTINPNRQLLFGMAPVPSGLGDRSLIKQVASNLLSNAIKFSRARDIARIDVEGYEDADENVYLIRDNGVGFDMAYYHKLFGVFQRLHSPADFEGTGVGLAIVQRIIHKHGGRIWAEGRPNEGACFFFTLRKPGAVRPPA